MSMSYAERNEPGPEHARALELRQQLADLHTDPADATPDLGAQIAAAEQALTNYLIAHRAVLGETDFWSGDYAAIDEDPRDAQPDPVETMDEQEYDRDLPTLAATDLVQVATAFLTVLGNIRRPGHLREATHRARCAIERLSLALEDLDGYLDDTEEAAARAKFVDTTRVHLPAALRPHLDLEPESAGPGWVTDMLTAAADLINLTASVAAVHHRAAGDMERAARLDGVLAAASIAVTHASTLHTTEKSAQ